MFDFALWDNRITMSEIFYDMVRLAKDSDADKSKIDSIVDEFEKHDSLHRIYTRMNELKYDKIDWARGVEDGLFSLMNYYQIPALKEFREIGKKHFLDNYPKEEYSKGLEVIKELEEKYKD